MNQLSVLGTIVPNIQNLPRKELNKLPEWKLQRALATVTQKQFTDDLKELSETLDSNGLPSQRGNRIYTILQHRLYEALGLSKDQRADYKFQRGMCDKTPLLNALTKTQLSIVDLSKRRLMDVLEKGHKEGKRRDVINKEVTELLEELKFTLRPMFIAAGKTE